MLSVDTQANYPRGLSFAVPPPGVTTVGTNLEEELGTVSAVYCHLMVSSGSNM